MKLRQVANEVLATLEMKRSGYGDIYVDLFHLENSSNLWLPSAFPGVLPSEITITMRTLHGGVLSGTFRGENCIIKSDVITDTYGNYSYTLKMDTEKDGLTEEHTE